MVAATAFELDAIPAAKCLEVVGEVPAAGDLGPQLDQVAADAAGQAVEDILFDVVRKRRIGVVFPSVFVIFTGRDGCAEGNRTLRPSRKDPRLFCDAKRSFAACFLCGAGGIEGAKKYGRDITAVTALAFG